MNKKQLLQKLEAMIDEIESGRVWANVEIEFREGVANMIRSTKNEKLQTQENTREPQTRTYRS